MQSFDLSVLPLLYSPFDIDDLTLPQDWKGLHFPPLLGWDCPMHAMFTFGNSRIRQQLTVVSNRSTTYANRDCRHLWVLGIRPFDLAQVDAKVSVC